MRRVVCPRCGGVHYATNCRKAAPSSIEIGHTDPVTREYVPAPGSKVRPRLIPIGIGGEELSGGDLYAKVGEQIRKFDTRAGRRKAKEAADGRGGALIPGD